MRHTSSDEGIQPVTHMEWKVTTYRRQHWAIWLSIHPKRVLHSIEPYRLELRDAPQHIAKVRKYVLSRYLPANTVMGKGEAEIAAAMSYSTAYLLRVVFNVYMNVLPASRAVAESVVDLPTGSVLEVAEPVERNTHVT